MGTSSLLYEKRDDGIAVLTLSRPERLNALSGPLLDELRDAVEEVNRDPDVRVYLLCGAPRPDGSPCFSAGVDVKAFADGQGVTNEQGFDLANRIDDLLKPSIAVIDGICTTGAAELALACDFRLVGETAQISDWHLKKLGIGLGTWGGTVRWAREVGITRAKEMLMTGKVIDGEQAHHIGFASAVHPSHSLMENALAFAGEIAAMDPRGVRLLLANLDRLGDMSRDQANRWSQLSAEWFDLEISESELPGRILGSD